MRELGQRERVLAAWRVLVFTCCYCTDLRMDFKSRIGHPAKVGGGSLEAVGLRAEGAMAGWHGFLPRMEIGGHG